MEMKLYDSELKLMEIIWESEPLSAKEIAQRAATEIGWNKNTTYTILKKLIEKKVILRTEPNFVCHAQIGKQEVQRAETKGLINKLFGGSRRAFFAVHPLFARSLGWAPNCG